MMHGGDVYNNRIKLDYSVNLNPYCDTELMKKKLQGAIEMAEYYPDINQTLVRKKLAELDKTDWRNVIAGSGASEMLMAVVRRIMPKKVVLLRPCFYGYEHCINSLKNCSIESRYLPYGDYIIEDITITDDTDLVIIADPVNPVGNNISSDFMEKLLSDTCKKGISVIVDESFFYLSDKAMESGHSINSMLSINPDTYIIRSFTKLFSMPGIRAGYMIASKDNISAVKMQLPEWNLSVMAEKLLLTGTDIILNSDYIYNSVSNIKAEREYMTGELNKLGITTYNSSTAYILMKSDINLYEELLKREILIRDCSDYEGLGKGYYRVAVKDRTNNEILISNIKEIISKRNGEK